MFTIQGAAPQANHLDRSELFQIWVFGTVAHFVGEKV